MSDHCGFKKVFRCGCLSDARGATPWPAVELAGIDGKVYRVAQGGLCWCLFWV